MKFRLPSFTSLSCLPSTGSCFPWRCPRFGMFLMMNNQIIIIILTMLGQMVLSVLAGTAWLHLWVYLFGGRQGLKNTFRAVANSMTPVLFLGWIMPMGMIVGTVWGIILEVLGIRELQKFTTDPRDTGGRNTRDCQHRYPCCIPGPYGSQVPCFIDRVFSGPLMNRTVCLPEAADFFYP